VPRLAAIWPELAAIDAPTALQVETDAQYSVYLDRQRHDIEAMRRDEGLELPADLDYSAVTGLSSEARQKLAAARPASLGQAARVDGVTPAALTRLLGWSSAGIRRTAPLRDAAQFLDLAAPVPREAHADLSRFVGMLAEWQRVHNLVGPAELASIWDRHIADSLQLLKHAGDFRSWVDLGSGAGFPALVVAIAARHDARKKFTLVEANGKKAAFLRAAIRELKLQASVAAARIEAHGPTVPRSADILSARALAPLPTLFKLAEPYFMRAAPCCCPRVRVSSAKSRKRARPGGLMW
jgi:16S rRNA (guanine(527)-N(7))-methyltransferase RsmG